MLFEAGQRTDAFGKALTGPVLTREVYEDKENDGFQSRVDIDAADKLQTTLLRAGVPKNLIKQSAINLRSFLGKDQAVIVTTEHQAQRPANAAERASMIFIIKRRLIDPASPVYGHADVVGNQACFTVNAKNGFGGYTGNREMVFVRNPKTKVWSGGGAIDYPHAVCLDN